jgi:ankyrin repeat protein
MSITSVELRSKNLETKLTTLASKIDTGELEFIRAFITNDKEVSCHRENNTLALRISLEKRSIPLAIEIIQGGDFEGTEALLLAVQGGHTACVKALLTSKAVSLSNIGDALYEAAKKGHLDCVEALLSGEAVSDVNRGRAVRPAAREGHLSCVEALLANGAISESDRAEAFEIANDLGHSACVQVLFPFGVALD